MKFNERLTISLMLISILALTVSVSAENTFQAQQQNLQQEDEVVAKIDDENIYMSELDQWTNLQQTMMQIQQQNPQFVQFLYSSPEGEKFIKAFKRDQLDDLIAKKLLEREVDRKNINLTKKDKDEYFKQQLEMIKKQQNMSDEDLLNALNNQGIESMEQFKEIFLKQQGEYLRVQKLIETVASKEFKISDKEAKEFFDKAQYQIDFEETKDQIKLELAHQKYIDQLKEKSEIKILLDT